MARPFRNFRGKGRVFSLNFNDLLKHIILVCDIMFPEYLKRGHFSPSDHPAWEVRRFRVLPAAGAGSAC